MNYTQHCTIYKSAQDINKQNVLYLNSMVLHDN